MVYKFFDKKSTAEPSSLERMGSGIASSSVLADELHKPIIKKFDKTKVYSQSKDNIWRVDLADMQSLSRKNKGIKYLLSAIDLHRKYASVIPLKDKKGISVVNAFNKIIKQSNRKPNKIWVDQGGEFYNNVFKKWLSDNDIIMYSTYNEGKSVVAERFIRTLKNKLYKHMTATSKNVYYDVLDDVVNKYNNTKHSTIKMKPIDVKDNNKRVYIDEHNEKDSRFISIKSDLNDYAKKTDVANDITTIKNDYASNAGLTSRLNDLKSQHIATEVKTIDDKIKKNASDILGFESRLKQKEDILDDVKRENALTSGRDDYLDKMYLLYECK